MALAILIFSEGFASNQVLTDINIGFSAVCYKPFYMVHNKAAQKVTKYYGTSIQVV